MTWRQSNNKQRCHDCRVVPPAGAPVWQGDHTPAIWDEACAGKSLGKTLGDAQEVPKYLGSFAGFDMAAMKQRLREAILARRDGRALAAGRDE